MNSYPDPIQCSEHIEFDVHCTDCRFLTLADREDDETMARTKLEQIEQLCLQHLRGLTTATEALTKIEETIR